MLKSSMILIALFNCTCIWGQLTTVNELRVTAISNAEDQRWTYHLLKDSILVETGSYKFSKKNDNFAFSTKLNERQLKRLTKISARLEMDSFNTYYQNQCLMMGGQLLYFNFNWKDKKVQTITSNFYLNKLGQLVKLVNALVPDKYKIYYNKKINAKIDDCVTLEDLHK